VPGSQNRPSASTAGPTDSDIGTVAAASSMMSTPAEIGERRAKVERALGDGGVDAALFASESNFAYLTGYTSGSWANKTFPLFLLIVPGERPRAIVGGGEVESIEADGGDLEVIAYSRPSRVEGLERSALDFVPHAADQSAGLLRAAGVRRLAIEQSLPFGPRLSFDMIAAVGRSSGVETVDVAPLMSSLRQIKSAAEIRAIAETAAVLAHSYELFETRAEGGMTERELKRSFVAASSEAGADRVGYVGAIADARRASLGGPSDRAWEPGDLLMFDACIEVGGYWADFCRIYANVEPTAAQAEAYEDLRATVAQARETVAAGVPIADVATVLVGGDRASGSVYGRSGHGIGLDYTEPPSLHVEEPAAAVAGMVLCLEPNRSIPGVGNLTAEEEVAVLDDGVRLLSPPFPQRIAVLG
jgi:Xaa-Pro aminopeptidase